MSTPKEPRSGAIVLGGIPWLARMIDKARLEAEGTIDVFDLDFPCPMDQGLLGRLNLDAKTFQKLVQTHEDDVSILKALESKGVHVQY